ncbi:uncharacterized protein LOC130768995 isoform X3 [Actinidia eriantha]|uniref:uncharacterized protein LOC130768995 isoform X3 n=1 Tax=Actinidia eriantha TaxID=165200 RepID=UPI00258E5211|nr:uncharacterized protein LOC130768995 isoform X3 [Actinidia eriantha]
MDNLTIFGNLDENLEETVQFLRQRNKVVIIRDEREYNAIRLSEEKEKTKTNASTSSKGKEITTSSTKSIGSNPREIVKLPSTIHSCRNLNQLLSRVYPQLDVPGTVSPTFLTERTILCARNEHVTAINIATLNIFPGEPTTYLAADKMSEDDEVDRNITNRYPNEYLNSLNPPGLPPFKVELKVGCPIMLLRNIAPNDGLCNGTRLMVVRCASRIIEAQILTGDKRGNLVFIPRISLTPSSSKFPFRMTRRQFPIRLAYAMTINKSQGQSVKYVGIDLRTPVFSHGQLYVALSRCTTFHRISVLPEQEMDSTTNIVYPEVLL